MSLTRKPLTETWKKKKEMDDEKGQGIETTVDTEKTPEVPEKTETESLKRKHEVLETPDVTQSDVAETVLQQGMCQTWKRSKKNEAASQCGVKPRNGHDKCFSHGTNRREIQEKEQTTCDTCLTTVSKGSIDKHRQSNRHKTATKFVTEKAQHHPEPECTKPHVSEKAELEVPEKTEAETKTEKKKPRVLFEMPVGGNEPLMLNTLLNFNRGVVPASRPKKDYSSCFGVTTL